MEGLYGYLCFYRGRRIEVYAETLYRAKCKAAEMLKVSPKNSMRSL